MVVACTKTAFAWYPERERKETFLFAHGGKECRSLNLKISQNKAYLGETNFSLIACLHVCLYFFITFHVERQGAQREREKNKPC